MREPTIFRSSQDKPASPLARYAGVDAVERTDRTQQQERALRVTRNIRGDRRVTEEEAAAAVAPAGEICSLPQSALTSTSVKQRGIKYT